MYLCAVVGPRVPLRPRGTVPLVLLCFFWLHLLSRSSLLTRALRVPPAPLCLSPGCRPVASASVRAFLPSSTPIRWHSDGPVCTFPSAVSAVAVHSPVCAGPGFCLCPIPLSLPISPGVGSYLPLLTLMGYCPHFLCYAPLPRLSPRPRRHGGGIYVRTGLPSCL